MKGYFMKSVMLLLCILLVPLAALSAIKPVSPGTDCGPKGCPNEKGVTLMQVEGDALVKKYCTTCHTESRIMDKLKHLQKGRNEGYEQSVKSIVVKMIRLTGGEISHRDGKKILEYLVTL